MRILVAAPLVLLSHLAVAQRLPSPVLDGLSVGDGALSLRPAATAALDWNHMPSSLWVGGSADYRSSQLLVRGAPYGECGTGVVASVWASNRSLAHSPEGVSCSETQPDQIARNGLFDAVSLYYGGENYGPALTVGDATAVSYDAGKIYFKPPLSAEQRARIHPLQWVYTNSTVPGFPSAPGAGGYQPYDSHYVAAVTSVDAAGAWVSVAGWSVPGGCTNDPAHCALYAGGALTPSLARLDTANGHTNPTVFFGAPNQLFAFNAVLQNNPGLPQNKDSYIRGLQWGEADIQDYASVDYATHVAGLSIAYSPIGGARPARDSYGEYVSGPFPVGQMTSLLLEPDGMGTANITSRHTTYVDASRLSLVEWTQRTSAVPGWPGATSCIGKFVDSADNLDLRSNPRARVCWDEPGYSGGFCLEGTLNQGLCVSSAGLAVATQGLAVTGNGAVSGTLTAASLQVGHARSVAELAAAIPCNSAAEGTHAAVTDALAPAYLGTLSGGGAVHAPAYCNGSGWVAD